MESIGKGRTVCSFCGEEISLDARRCPYCGSVLKEDSLNNGEVRNDSLNVESSPQQDTNSDLSKGLFDNSINTDNHADDFIHEERHNEEKIGLFDNNATGEMDQKSGMFDNNATEDMDQKSGLFDNNATEDMDQKSGLFDNNTTEEMNQKSGLFDNNTTEEMDQKSGLFDAKPSEQIEEKNVLLENTDNHYEEKNDEPQKVANGNQEYQDSMPVQKTDMESSARTQRPMNNRIGMETSIKPSISNAMKVFITTICNIIPGIGQLVGVIIAIVFMNSEGDTDKRSFGLALLVSSIAIFVFWCISCCVMSLAWPQMY